MQPWQVLALIICACIGIPIGRYKNDWWLGFLAGLLLGSIGLAIMLLIPQSEKARVRRATTNLRAEEEARRRLAAEREARP